MLPRHRLKLLDTPIQWVAAPGFEQLGRGVHGGQSITRNINCQAVPTWVLAQSSNVSFVPFRKAMSALSVGLDYPYR